MRRALVTGASSDDGLAVIRNLLNDGWEVISTSRSQPLVPAQERYHWHCLDLSDDRFTYGLANMIRHQPIDVLVHCAPAHVLAPVIEHVGRYLVAGATFTGAAFLDLCAQGLPVLHRWTCAGCREECVSQDAAFVAAYGQRHQCPPPAEEESAGPVATGGPHPPKRGQESNLLLTAPRSEEVCHT